MWFSEALFLHNSLFSSIILCQFQLPQFSEFWSLSPQNSETSVGLGSPFPRLWSDKCHRQKVRLIIEFISFVFLLSGNTILFCWLSNVWKQMFHIISPLFSLFMVGGGSSNICYSPIVQSRNPHRVSFHQPFSLKVVFNLTFYYLGLWRRQWHPTPVLLPGKYHGRRSLVGCRQWGHTESDTTEAT